MNKKQLMEEIIALQKEIISLRTTSIEVKPSIEKPVKVEEEMVYVQEEGRKNLVLRSISIAKERYEFFIKKIGNSYHVHGTQPTSMRRMPNMANYYVKGYRYDIASKSLIKMAS